MLMCRRGNGALGREVRQECDNRGLGRPRGVLLAVTKNEASNPIDIDLFGTDAVVMLPTVPWAISADNPISCAKMSV